MTVTLIDGGYDNLYGKITIDSLGVAVFKWTVKVENKKKYASASTIYLELSGMNISMEVIHQKILLL